MTDTAQPATAAETVVESRADQLAAAADVFKVSLGQIDAAELPPRGSDGRFTSAQAGEEEIEAPEEAVEAEAGAESQEEEQGTEEAAEEAQPAEVALPSSWPAEHAETWQALPPEAQAIIVEREGQRDRAVNLKFQEAANVLKANEAVVTEAQSNRQRYAEAADLVLSLAVPNPPPLTMLDRNSNDYDPDEYHYQKAIHDQTIATLAQHRNQLGQIRAQEEQGRFNALNNATRDAFMQAVPDVADQAKAPAIFTDLIEYAVSLGTPAETFNAPTSALEWHFLWKAREFDRLQAAKAKVQTEPKPEPRRPQPAVRPGVTTPRAAIEQGRTNKALDRLRQSGSVQAGADAIKHLLKGKLG